MWVKLTTVDGTDDVFVNLDRFDQIFARSDKTVLLATISDVEQDYSEIYVRETPEEIMKLAGVLVPHHVEEEK